MAGFLERARARLGEGRRVGTATQRLAERAELVRTLPQGLQDFIADAAGRGSTRVLDAVTAGYSEQQIEAASKVASLMRDGGFVVLPNLRGQSRVTEATIIGMTDTARRDKSLPSAPGVVGEFSHYGNDDETPMAVRERLEGLLGIPESELPQIPYKKTQMTPPVRSGGHPIEDHASFEQVVYYIPPGSHRDFISGGFRGLNPQDSDRILRLISGAIGRELSGRKVGTPIGPVFSEQAIVAGRRHNTRGLDARIAQDERRAVVESAYATNLTGERERAKEIMDPLFQDMEALSFKVFFPKRRISA